MNSRQFLLGSVLSCLFLAACGGDSTADEEVSSTTAPSATSSTTAAVEPEEAAVVGSSPGVVAAITFSDGTEVEVSGERLDELADTLLADEAFVAAAFGPPGVPVGFRTGVLTDLVVDATIEHLFELEAVPVGERQDAAARDEAFLQLIVPIFQTEDDPLAAAEASVERLPYLPFLLDLQAKQTALGTALLAAASLAEMIEVPCSSHILLETEDEANDVIALLDDGGDFAELAMEFSTGPTGPSGGDLGCTDPNAFVPEFGDAIVDAPVGTIIGPVQTQFGFHVITVTEIAEQPADGADPTTLAIETISAELADLAVVIPPALGTWDPAATQVVPAG